MSVNHEEIKRSSYKLKSGTTVGTLIVSNQRIMFQNKKNEVTLNAFFDKHDAEMHRTKGYDTITAIKSSSSGFRSKNNRLTITIASNVGNRPIEFKTQTGQAGLIETDITNAYQERKKLVNQENLDKAKTKITPESTLRSKIPANIPDEQIWLDTWYDKDFNAYISLNENLKSEYNYKTELYQKYLEKTGIDAFVVKEELVKIVFGYPGIIHPTNKKDVNRYRLLPVLPENAITEKIAYNRIMKVFASDVKYDTVAPRFWNNHVRFCTYPVTEQEYEFVCSFYNKEPKTKEDLELLMEQEKDGLFFEDEDYMEFFKQDILNGVTNWFEEIKTNVEIAQMEKIRDEMIKLFETLDYEKFREELQLVEHEGGFQSMIYTPHAFRRVKQVEIDGIEMTILVQFPNEVAVFFDETMANEQMLRCSTVEKTWRKMIDSELDESIQRQNFAKAIIENNFDEAKKIRNYVLERLFENEKYPYSVAFPKSYDLALALKDPNHEKALENC